MKPSLPLCSKPVAYGLMVKQCQVLHKPAALLNGAVAIALQHDQRLDPTDIDAEITELAEAVTARVKGPQPQALMAHLHDVLFEEEGFTGNNDDYYIPANSFLPEVLKSRRGLPITLSLIYKLVCDKIGIPCEGIGLPGHFIVSVQVDDKPMLIDPFYGGCVLTIDEARQRMRDTVGDEASWSDDYLKPVSNQHWLTRMLQNLLHCYASSGQYSELAAMLELEMAIWPQQTRLQKDLAQVLARIGRTHEASAWLSSYLSANPHDPEKSYLEQLLAVLTE